MSVLKEKHLSSSVHNALGQGHTIIEGHSRVWFLDCLFIILSKIQILSYFFSFFFQTAGSSCVIIYHNRTKSVSSLEVLDQIDHSFKLTIRKPSESCLAVMIFWKLWRRHLKYSTFIVEECFSNDSRWVEKAYTLLDRDIILAALKKTRVCINWNIYKLHCRRSFSLMEADVPNMLIHYFGRRITDIS